MNLSFAYQWYLWDIFSLAQFGDRLTEQILFGFLLAVYFNAQFYFRYVQSELERVQGRLQRCVMDCNDSIKDKMPPNPTEDQVAKYTDQFERCAIKVSNFYKRKITSDLISIFSVSTHRWIVFLIFLKA